MIVNQSCTYAYITIYIHTLVYTYALVYTYVITDKYVQYVSVNVCLYICICVHVFTWYIHEKKSEF